MLFREVIGQEAAKEKLRQSVQQNRVAHAQLFLGESGYGTLPLALAYAQYANCHNPGPEDSCGMCDSCRKMRALEHPDVHFTFPFITSKSGTATTSADYLPQWREALKENPYLTYADWMDKIEAENKQGNITAKECRAIIGKLALKPMYKGWKILILWLPEYLGKEGNILLKILEEPPENTLFLLVAEDEEQILSTIRSRTQLTRLNRLSDEEVQTALQKEEEISAEEAARLARLANGSYSKALTLMSEVESNYSQAFIQWLRLCFKPDGGQLLNWVENMSRTGRENQKNFFSYGLGLLRECMLWRENLAELNRALEAEQDFVDKFSRQLHPGNIFSLVELLNESHYFIERNANPKILFFNLSLRIHQLLRAKAPATS